MQPQVGAPLWEERESPWNNSPTCIRLHWVSVRLGVACRVYSLYTSLYSRTLVLPWDYYTYHIGITTHKCQMGKIKHPVFLNITLIAHILIMSSDASKQLEESCNGIQIFSRVIHVFYREQNAFKQGNILLCPKTFWSQIVYCFFLRVKQFWFSFLSPSNFRHNYLKNIILCETITFTLQIHNQRNEIPGCNNL